MNTATPTPDASNPAIHLRIGVLARQLHDSLQQLGLTEKLLDTAQELPNAKSRLSYISRLTGEAAEKVLNRVEQAKNQHAQITAETRRMATLLAKDPVDTVADGHLVHYLNDMLHSSHLVDQHLTDIMMAQDFHDLTGQVISRVVNLASTIEQQLIELLVQTAPPGTTLKPCTEQKVTGRDATVMDKERTEGMVTDQAQVDELLASLGF